MLGHFNSIIPLAYNAAKRTKLPMAANDPKETTIQSSNATSVAANRVFPSTIRTVLPDLKKLGMYYAFYTVVATLSLSVLMNHMRGHKTNNFIDSLYMCVVTMTSVGYGDLFPGSVVSQLVCSVLIAGGMLLFGIVVKIAAKYLVFKQQAVLLNSLHVARKIGPTDALNEIETLSIDYNKCIVSLFVMGVHFVVGIYVLCTVEEMEFDNAFYCASSTMTTVGFGDVSFMSESGRMFGMIWIFTGTSCVGQLFLYIAEVYTDIEAKKFVKWVISNNVIDRNEIKAADDLEKDKVHRAADFILYKLKDMGKITQEDISSAMKDLGVDDRSVFDVIPSQSSEKKTTTVILPSKNL
ncbi:hypothetical protein HRI_004825000 [Hibiscus trionum]|uniref:Potassium channel domain-containing protein n=1 Tax=Hibiscus trionum TaxID=183268 RepID=A0A9W7MNE2_HIBTR|nr:hypothetical protein HRI_004825000 [Hibiscus trionum]